MVLNDGLVWLTDFVQIYKCPLVYLLFLTFLGLQVITSNIVNGHIILLLSLHKHRSISPLGHKSITALNKCSLISTSMLGASLQKQNPAKANLIKLFILKIWIFLPGLHPINVMRLPRRSSLNEIGPLVKLPAEKMWNIVVEIINLFVTDLEHGHTRTYQYQKDRNFGLSCPGSPWIPVRQGHQGY